MISDFTKVSQEKLFVNDTPTERITFSFTVPFIADPDEPSTNYVSGFQLFRNSEIVYETLLSSLTVESGVATLVYDFSDLPSQNIDFQIREVDYDVTYGTLSNVVSIESFPDGVTQCNTFYYKDFVRIRWTGIDTTSNPLFQKYSLLRGELIQNAVGATTSIVDSIDAEEDQVEVTLKTAKTGYVKIVYQEHEWVKFLSADTTFTLTNSDLESFSDLELRYQDIEKTKFYVYFTETLSTVVSELPLTIETSTGSVVQYTYDDTSTLEDDTRYVYAITTSGVTSTNELLQTADDIFITDASPKILHWSLQSDTYLSSDKWRNMKKVIVDGNIYDKGYWAIPYREKTEDADAAYVLDGWNPIAEDYVDVYVNGHFKETVLTTSTGFFSFNFDPRQLENTIKLQISTPGRPADVNKYTINAYNLLTHFNALGAQVDELEEENDRVDNDFFIDTATDTDTLDSNFGELINVKYSPDIDGDIDTYREVLKGLLEAHNEFGLLSSTQIVLDTFSQYFDTATIYEKDSHLSTYTPGISPIIDVPLLERENYYYGITAVTESGGETSPLILNYDKRWWPFFEKAGIGFSWSRVEDAQYYRIYRGTSEDDLEFLISTSTGDAHYTQFLDTGSLLTSTGINPPTFNFTEIDTVAEAEEILFPCRFDNYWLRRTTTGVTVVITTSEEEFPELILNRLYNFLSLSVVPLRLRLIVAHETYIIYKDGATAIQYVEGTSGPVLYTIDVGGSGNPWVSDGSYYSFTITHSLDNQDVFPQGFILASGVQVVPGFRRLDNNTIKVFWNNNTDVLRINILELVEV